jgi:tRNA acetyltransferase TAN1
MSDAKKMKFDKKKKFYGKSDHSKKNYLECGQRGFLATCNFREKDTVRECYNILNDYADQLYSKQNEETPKALAAGSANPKDSDDEPEEIDISKQLEQEISDKLVEHKKKAHRFQVVDTGCTNCVFVKTSLTDPVELGEKIMTDTAETKVRKTRHLLRLIPVEAVCKANLTDIMNAGGQLFDKYFLKEGKTFSIVFNRRYNNDISRDTVIKELAELIDMKNMKNKVDLKNPQLSVIVEVIKGLCCLSVLPNYMKLKKYNLSELTATKTEGGECGEKVAAPEAATPEKAVEVSSDEKVEEVKVTADEKPIISEVKVSAE